MILRAALMTLVITTSSVQASTARLGVALLFGLATEEARRAVSYREESGYCLFETDDPKGHRVSRRVATTDSRCNIAAQSANNEE